MKSIRRQKLAVLGLMITLFLVLQKGEAVKSRPGNVGGDLAAVRSLLVAADVFESDVERAVRGFQISPILLRTDGKTPEQITKIGIGSYLVNGAVGCGGCHTWSGVRNDDGSNYLPGGDPFLGQPERIDVANFMSGGAAFGPFTSRNLTPDPDPNPDHRGRPGRPGMSEEEFIRVMRTGVDRRDQGLMQVMPWPEYRKMSDFDLQSVYAYLKEIPTVNKDIPDSPKVP